MGSTKENPDWLDRGLFPFASRFAEIDGNTVHYIDEGSGPVLLLLHGNPRWSFLYRHIVRKLSPSFRCIALDYPGFGLSTPRLGYKFLPREHSDVLEEFVDHLGFKDLRIMVQDWGGPIGKTHALTRSRLTRRRCFTRMRHMAAGTMVNTEMFYAPDAADRVVAFFRSFGKAEAIPPAAEA